jgi:hypothetical protein
LSAAAIWWITASAAMLVTLPTIDLWLFDSAQMWLFHISMIFPVAYGRPWVHFLYGVGIFAGSIACLSGFGAVVWTLHRGAGGRWALRIPAVVWLVFALGYFGTGLVEFLYYMATWSRSPGEFVSASDGAATVLCNLAGWLAFPPAIWVALTLSDAQAKLVGK